MELCIAQKVSVVDNPNTEIREDLNASYHKPVKNCARTPEKVRAGWTSLNQSGRHCFRW